MKRDARSANLLLAAVATAVVLLAAEVALRALLPEPVRTFPGGVVTRTTTAEYDVEIATNREGFRDVDHERVKPPGVVRITVMGDSFVFGSGVAFDSIFPTRLQAILSEAGRPVEVLNFGVVGTGPVHALRLWRRIVSPYHPDIVLVCLYAGNDAADALRESSEQGPRWVTLALARAAAARWRRSLRPDQRTAVGRNGDAQPSGDVPAETQPGGWNAFGTENPARLDALLEEARKRGVPAESVRVRLAAVPDSLVADALAFRSNPFNLAQAVLDPGSLRKSVLLETDEMERGWDCAELALRELRADIERSGGRMVLVCIPAGAQVDRRYWWAVRLGLELDERVLRDPVFQDRLARFAAKEDLLLIDLLPVMKAHPDEALYYEQDGHWNARGHQAAAQAIAGSLGGL